MNSRFAFHAWRREVSNASILKYRDYQGFLVTSANSGTQWLNYMLSLAIARRLDLPPPRYVNNEASNEFIGHPKHPRIHPQAPRLASTHSIPHRLFDSRLLRGCIAFPPFAVLVRDIRAVLVSNYERFRVQETESFSTFLRGDITGNRHRADIWWCLRFHNRWGRVLERFPAETLLLRYEDLRRDTKRELARLAGHFRLDIDESDLDHAVAHATKEAMAKRIDPGASATDRRFVRFDERQPLAWFSAEDLAFFRQTLRENLRHDLGYDYGLGK